MKEVFVLTEKESKVVGLRESVRALGIQTPILQSPDASTGKFEEPQLPSAAITAAIKGNFGQREYLRRYPESDPHEIANIGVDTVHLDPKPKHKLKDAKEETVMLALSELQRLLSWARKDQQQPFAWAIAISSWNGADVTLEYFVAMKARSIDPDVLRQAIEDAVETGIITKVNTRIGLIELLLELQAIDQIAIARNPQSYDWSHDLAVDHDVQIQVQAAILETNPFRLVELQPARIKH